MMECSDDYLTFFGLLLAPFCSACVLGSVDVALLNATLIWSKCWTPRKVNIVTAIVVILAVILTDSISIPFGTIQIKNDTKMHSNITGITARTEAYTNGNFDISEKQKMIFDITMLLGTSSMSLPVILKLPSSGMMNMFLAQVGVYVAIPDMTGFIQRDITPVVISSLFFPVISSGLSIAVFLGIKVILSKLNPDTFLQGYLPFLIAFLAAESTFALLHQDFFFVEYIPVWLKLIIAFLMAFFAWLAKKYVYPYRTIRLRAVNDADQVSLSIMHEDMQSSKISEANLARIASCFGPNWEPFMKLLGITEADIHEMKYDFPDDRPEQVYRCLRRSQERNPEKATLKCIVENSSATHLNMKKFKAVLKEMENQGGNTKEVSITVEDEEDWSSDGIENLNISLLLKFQTVCSIFIHGSAVIGHFLGPVTSLGLIATRCWFASELTFVGGILLRLYICLGVVIGVVMFGHRIIGNFGLNELSPLRCFCIESGFALTTLLASSIGLPLSSTIWKTVSIFSVGYFKSSKKPNLRFCLQILVMALGCVGLAFLMNVCVAQIVLYYNL